MATLIHYPQRTEFSDTVPARLVVKLHSSLTLINDVSDHSCDDGDAFIQCTAASSRRSNVQNLACVGPSVLRTC